MWLFRSTAVMLAYLGIGIYTGVRVFVLVKYFLPSLRAFIFWPLYCLCCFSFVFVHLVRLDRIHLVRQAAMFSLPLLVYFSMSLLLFDALRLVLRFLKRAPSPGFSAAGTGIALGLAFLVIVCGFFHARNLHTAYYNITLNKDGDSFRAVLISDLHIGTTVDRRWTAKIVDTVNDARPDIVCIAGDIVESNIHAIREREAILAELRRLNAPLGVYACPGNHDVDRLSLRSVLREDGGTDRVREFLQEAGIVFLQDEAVLIDERFYLVGRRDLRPIGARGERKSAAELIADLDKSRPVIVMDHQPFDFPAEEKAGADLIFSGHTHGGQFFPGNIATARIFRKAGAVHYGYWRGDFAQGVVSSGAGVWGLPMRIASRSEVAVVNIKF